MHNIAGAIHTDRQRVLDFLFSALNLMREEGCPEYGVGINGYLYKNKDKIIRPNKEFYFCRDNMDEEMGLAHIHRSANPENKHDLNVGPFLKNDTVVVAIGHFGQYIEIKNFLQNRGYSFETLNFGEVFTFLVDYNLSRHINLYDAVNASKEMLNDTHNYAILVQDYRFPNQMVALLKGVNFNFYYSTSDGIFISTQHTPLKTEGVEFKTLRGGKEMKVIFFQRNTAEIFKNQEELVG